MARVGPSPDRFWSTPVLKLLAVLQGMAVPAQRDRRKRLPLPAVASARRHSFPALPGSPWGDVRAGNSLTQGTTSKRCLPFQLCFSYGDPGLLLFLQARDRATDTFTSPREGAAESPAGSSPLSELESNAKPQPDLRWCVVFLLFDSKHPGTCFLTSLCIHAENKQSLYKTPNISP